MNVMYYIKLVLLNMYSYKTPCLKIIAVHSVPLCLPVIQDNLFDSTHFPTQRYEWAFGDFGNLARNIIIPINQE